MNDRIVAAEKALATLADAPAPPADAKPNELLDAAASLLVERKRLIGTLEALSHEECICLRQRPGIASRIAMFRASTSDWSREITRARQVVSSQLGATRKLRRRGAEQG